VAEAFILSRHSKLAHMTQRLKVIVIHTQEQLCLTISWITKQKHFSTTITVGGSTITFLLTFSVNKLHEESCTYFVKTS
jgi:hypothetical protein